MLINLSNHPVDSWSESQREAGIQQFGTVVDVPFPEIPPELELNEISKMAEDYVEKCTRMIKEESVRNVDSKNAVHVMGEMTFVYQFVQKISEQGIECLAATSRRIVVEEKNGTKVSRFEFVRFRAYTEELY